MTWPSVTPASTAPGTQDPRPAPGSGPDDRFRIACEIMADGLLMCTSVRDESGAIIDFRCDHINRPGARILGVEPDELIGRRLGEVFPVYPQSGLFRRTAEIVTNGRTHYLRGVRQLGEWTHQGYQQRLFDGALAAAGDGFVGVFHDVTVRQRTAEELDKRVQERTAELTAANAELATFSYSVSHDLRAPLRAIEGFSQIVLRDHSDQLDQEGRHALDRVIAGVTRMNELINALLGLSRVSSHPIAPQIIDLSRLTAEVADELKATCPDHPATLTVQQGLSAYGDPDLLRVLMTNLLSNACKFTTNTPDAKIDVGTEPIETGEAAFYVRDNGAGFDMAHAERLFRPFERLHRQSEYGGTGVGLATVQRIVRRHGGRVWAVAAVGQGATFYFTLPPQPPPGGPPDGDR